MNNSHLTADPSKSLVARIIDWSISNRFFILLITIIIAVWGVYSIKKMPLDAIPDLSDTQIILRTDWPGQAPQVVEDQVTFPMASQMLGLPKTKDVRGFSMFGTSFVYIVFEDDVDMYWARTRVLESLSQITSQLPEEAKPQLGPDATGVGWVFQYALYDRSEQFDLQQLRSIQDWFIRFELASVEGVAEVASVGGFVKEYQVVIDPNKLRSYNLNLPEVIKAVRAANSETGGRTLEMAETEYLVRSFGYIESPSELEEVVIKSDQGIPITIGDIGRVVQGPSIRRGISELNGEGEVVGGIVIMRPDSNALSVIEAIKDKLEIVKQGLPKGVELKVVYDRSQLIQGSVDYLKNKLVEEGIVVALITFLFLLHVRSALVAILTIPLGILIAFIIMNQQGISANIMSLGGIAIAIGAMVDASIVMVESAHRRLSLLPSQATSKEKNAILIQSAKEVGPGLFFSLLIITVSFLPVFALTGQSERLFSPLAYTKTYAMAAACLLSITLIPILMLWLIKGKVYREESNPINRFCAFIYRPCLNLALKWKKTTVLFVMAGLASLVIPMTKLGSEFMPSLYEGGMLYMPMTLPGVSPAKARDILQVTNRQLMTLPEVEHVFGKAGRANTATDPAPLAMLETWIELKPRNEWREGMTPEKLITEMDNTVRLPGVTNSWGYPIKIRLDMLTTGIRTPVGVKISGEDLRQISRIAEQVEDVARTVSGTRSAISERVIGGKYIEILPNRRELARYGISIETFQQVIQTALGGMQLDEVIEGRERYPLMLRYDRPFREGLNTFENVLVPAANGVHIPLIDLADIQINEGPAVIRSENARLNGYVFVDIENRDLGSYVDALQDALSTIELPAGYTLALSGQFEQLKEANARLIIAIPATLFIILVLLYMHFQRWDRTLITMLSVPFGLIGGFWVVYLAGYNLSVAVAVGFIALAGIAVETAVIMLLYIDQRMRNYPPNNYEEFINNVRLGAIQRLRPKLMTAGTIILGLIPVFLTDGPGADVMRRIALPMVGGMISTLVLTLIFIPVLYVIYFQRHYKAEKTAEVSQ